MIPVVDLEDGGAEGGRILCEGTPTELAADEASVTGRWLKEVLEPRTKVGSKTGSGRARKKKAPPKRKKAGARE